MIFKQRNRNKKLLRAVSEGKTAKVIQLLNEGADANARDGFDCALGIAGRSPYSNVEIVRILLEYGADINGSPNGKGIYPLIRAAHQSDEARIKLLIEHGSDLNKVQAKPVTPGLSPFQELIRWSSLELLMFAVENDADINQATDTNMTPLHIAASIGRLDVVKWLISQGASIEALNNNNKTPLDCAISQIDQPYFHTHPESNSTIALKETVHYLQSYTKEGDDHRKKCIKA